jgi:hypothetical protein
MERKRDRWRCFITSFEYDSFKKPDKDMLIYRDGFAEDEFYAKLKRIIEDTKFYLHCDKVTIDLKQDDRRRYPGYERPDV